MEEKEDKQSYSFRMRSNLVEQFKSACKYERRAIGTQLEMLIEEFLAKVDEKKREQTKK